MTLFDMDGQLKKYDNVEDFLREFYVVRLDLYDKRKRYLIRCLEAESTLLSNKARYVTESIQKEIVFLNASRVNLIEQLVKLKYDPDPLKRWKDELKKVKIRYMIRRLVNSGEVYF